jgi:hypothetical protein
MRKHVHDLPPFPVLHRESDGVRGSIRAHAIEPRRERRTHAPHIPLPLAGRGQGWGSLTKFTCRILRASAPECSKQPT